VARGIKPCSSTSGNGSRKSRTEGTAVQQVSWSVFAHTHAASNCCGAPISVWFQVTLHVSAQACKSTQPSQNPHPAPPHIPPCLCVGYCWLPTSCSTWDCHRRYTPSTAVFTTPLHISCPTRWKTYIAGWISPPDMA
jgi:hypothetical protein